MKSKQLLKIRCKDNKIKTEHNQLAYILFLLKQMKFNKYIIWLT